jgi:endo-1,4-beta-xylanase
LADTLVRFAKDNKMKVRGHTLVWHNQTPDFFFKNEKGEKLDSTALYKKLEQYMKTVMTHFGDDVYVWDVVNEALSDSPAEFYRTKSPWYETCGSGFIEKAFRMAHAINPNAKLFYNDYNLIQPVKRDKAYRMLKELLAKGVPINGVGMQGHWAVSDVTREKIQQSIDLFSSLGIDIQITELDLTVYGNYHGENVKNQTKETIQFTPEIADIQAASYKMIFETFRANKSKISSVTFWGLSDKHSWLNNFPIKGRKDYPLLFDDNLHPKPAFWEVVKWDENN